MQEANVLKTFLWNQQNRYREKWDYAFEEKFKKMLFYKYFLKFEIKKIKTLTFKIHWIQEVDEKK